VQSELRSLLNEEKQQDHFSEEQIEELYPKLLKYCQFLSKNKWDGDDLVQEALLKAWHHYKHKPGVSSALVNKIAYNQWIDTIRKRNRETIESIGDDTKTACYETEQTDIRFDVVRNLMNNLTPKQAVIFTLKEAFQFQNSEIAELLNTTETAVKSALYRAKKRLEKKNSSSGIGQYWDEAERDHLSTIMHQALTIQDPTILIKAIPFISSIQKETTRPIGSMHQKRPSLTPSSIVYLAA
jgi:RNA polymerase sigma factor (sigma-70 family)